MKVSLLADHPHQVNIIADWYYNEWAYLMSNLSKEALHGKITEKAQNRNEIPLMIVVHDNSELVGVVELKYRENESYPEYEHWLGGVFVALTSRGKGVASLLISEAKSKAAKLSVKKLYLQCESFNVDIYRKYGFKELHQATHHGIETTIMVHDVT